MVVAVACSDTPEPTTSSSGPEFSAAQASDRFSRVSEEALGVHGAVYVDLDESTGRVNVGIERGNSAAHANVRSAVARLGLRSGDVAFADADPILPMAGLRDLVRPTVAGLQIHFGQYVCSIGFNATDGGQASFVTASHCTNRQGGTEGTQYYQALSSQAGSFVGTEAEDPAYSRGAGCPKGKKCRRSDAARVAYAAGVPFSFGIAQTTGANNGSLTIAGTFAVTADDNSGGSVGQTANKVGRTTGWTAGPITNTCVNTAVSGSNIVLLCQTFVSAGVGGGDSGSDVFRLSGGSATLLGVLWGGNGAGTQFVFSPLGNVRQELGNLVTH